MLKTKIMHNLLNLSGKPYKRQRVDRYRYWLKRHKVKFTEKVIHEGDFTYSVFEGVDK